MQAGKLRHRVTIQQKTAGSPDKTPSGAPDDAWADVATVWGSIEPLRGKELFDAQAVQSSVDVRIRIRYRAGVTAAMRCTHNGVVYAIDAVINPGLRNIELQLLCTSGVRDG